MSASACLEGRYRRWLRWYPRWFRRVHEAEVLGVLMDTAREGQCRPDPADCLALVLGALGTRLRPRVARANRLAWITVRLLYLGAAVELVTAAVVVATMDAVKSAIVDRNPGYTAAQWHAEVTGSLRPLVVAAGIAAGLLLCLAWANGRGHGWTRVVFAVFFCETSYSLANGLAHGSAVYARADLAAGSMLWLVQLAAVVAICHCHAGLRKLAAGRPGADRIGPR